MIKKLTNGQKKIKSGFVSIEAKVVNVNITEPKSLDNVKLYLIVKILCLRKKKWPERITAE